MPLRRSRDFAEFVRELEADLTDDEKSLLDAYREHFRREIDGPDDDSAWVTA